MARLLFAWIALGLAALLSGCAACANPYDYCGPTYRGGTNSCCPTARAGSILSDAPAPAMEVSPAPTGGPAYIDEGQAPVEAEPAPQAVPDLQTAAPQRRRALARTTSSPNTAAGPFLTRDELEAGAVVLSVTDQTMEEYQRQKELASTTDSKPASTNVAAKPAAEQSIAAAQPGPRQAAAWTPRAR